MILLLNYLKEIRKLIISNNKEYIKTIINKL